MSSPVELFKELFRGNTSAYGVHIPAQNVPVGEKAKGESYTKNQPLTPELYEYHCAGETSLGVIPIDQNNNVRFMAINVDVYPLDPLMYCRTIDKFKLPLTCFKSKSGGLHLYCFFSADTPADKALDLLHVMRHLLKIPKDAETFPKQRRLTAKQKGNWINLPYYKGDESERVAYAPDGTVFTFEEAMKWCYNRRVTLKGLTDIINALPFSSAPPCIQSMYMNNEVSITSRNRNIFLFNACTYLKSRFKDEFPDKLALVNDELDKPLPITELETTIISSHTKGSYSYQCEDPHLHEHCDKELCKKREYGKGSGAVSNFSFERLTQVKSSPPYYKWIVNGVEMVFFSEAELRNQEKFMDFCMRHLHKLPNKLKAETWTEILNSALQDIEVEDMKDEDDLSNTSLWHLYLKEYLLERQVAQRPSQVTMGMVYYCDEKGGFFFRVESVIQFLENVKRFRAFTPTEMHYRLRKMGIKPTKVYDPTTKKAIRAWFCAKEILENPIMELSSETVLASLKEPDVAVAPATTKKATVKGKGVEKMLKLAEQLPDEPADLPPWETEEEPLDFTPYKDKEKF